MDYCSVLLYDREANLLSIAAVGAKSHELAAQLGLSNKTSVEIDQNGLSRCVRGQLVYEPDLAPSPFSFPKRLTAGRLRALVAAPLLVESQVFGIVLVARREPNSFSSGECEFLKQLSEHVALAAHQAEL